MNPAFADTFYWVALIHRKDASHQAVLDFSRGFEPLPVTTDEVLTEFLAFCSAEETLRKEARKAVRRILSGQRARHPTKPPRLSRRACSLRSQPRQGLQPGRLHLDADHAPRRSHGCSPTTGISSRKASGPYSVQRDLANEARRKWTPLPMILRSCVLR